MGLTNTVATFCTLMNRPFWSAIDGCILGPLAAIDKPWGLEHLHLVCTFRMCVGYRALKKITKSRMCILFLI